MCLKAKIKQNTACCVVLVWNLVSECESEDVCEEKAEESIYR